MSRIGVDFYVCDDLIERCDSLLKKNLVKFHNYSTQQEVLRLQIFETSNECKHLKIWLDAAYDEIITFKSQRSDLSRLYEALLKTNFVIEFLNFVSIQETFRLKFIETINEYRNMNGGLDIVNKNISTLKSEYNNLIRRYEISMENNSVEEFPECPKKLENLRLKFIEIIEENERLNGCLNAMFDGLAILNLEQDNLRQRYNTSLENNVAKEFLSYVKFQEELPKKSNDCDCSRTCLDRANENIASLNLQLKEAHIMLNSALLQREKIETERNSLDYLSEKLCRLLMRYLRLKLPEEMRKNFKVNDESMLSNSNFNTDHKPSDIGDFNAIVESNSSPISEISISESKIDVKDIKRHETFEDYQLSSYLDKDNKEPTIIKKEITDPDEISITFSTPANKSPELFNLDSTDDILPVKIPNVMELSPKVNETPGSVDPLEASSSSHQMELRTSGIRKLCSPTRVSIFECNTCGKSFPKKISIIRHIRAHMSLKCSFCDKRFAYSGSRKRHEREIHPREVLYGCNFCDGRFRRKELLAYHLQTKHSLKKRFKCGKCGKTFARKDHFKNHKSVHSSKRPYQCLRCDQRFKNRDSVRKHVRKIHEKDVDRYSCAECNKRYRSKRDLKKHILKIHL